ncbi:hypothetical protein FRC12_020533 [Ceratobasidium sp. 428]|nr:hypothetical protein FRC12_020533 [Ceratobasidium sp. 428]
MSRQPSDASPAQTRSQSRANARTHMQEEDYAQSPVNPAPEVPEPRRNTLRLVIPTQGDTLVQDQDGWIETPAQSRIERERQAEQERIREMAQNNEDLLERIRRLREPRGSPTRSTQSIPGGLHDWEGENTKRTIRAESQPEPTIIIEDEQAPNVSTATEADIIGGHTIPRRYPPATVETVSDTEVGQPMRRHPLSGTLVRDLPLPNVRGSISGEQREIQMPQQQPEALPPPPQRQVEEPPVEPQPVIRVQSPLERVIPPEQAAPLRLLPPPEYSSGGSSSSSSSDSEESDNEDENPLHLDPDVLLFIEQIVNTPLRRLQEGVNTALMNLGAQIAQNSTKLIRNTGQIRTITEATTTNQETIQNTLNHAAHGRAIIIQTNQRIEELGNALTRQRDGMDVLANLVTETFLGPGP